MPKVALSSHLVQVLSDFPDGERQRVLRALEKIHNGQFDNGLRVKKLKSRPGVAVWEARFSQAGRLLFTYGKHADRDSKKPVTTAHFWMAVFDHDKVSGILRRKQFETPEAMQWLLAEEVDCCVWTDKPIPDNPAADLGAIEEQFPDKEDKWEAYGVLSSEYDPVWTTPPMNLPWYLEGPTEFEMWADEQNIPAELILTPEQISLLSEPLPMFLNGPAGSGKTTLALYRLLALQEKNPDAKIAFVTSNTRLTIHAEEAYNALPTRPEEAETVDFLDYRHFVAQILDKPLSKIRKRIAQPDALRRLLSHRDLTNAEWQLFETEIRTVLKGRLAPRTKPPRQSDVSHLISFETYEDLPSDWSAVPEAKRPEVYRIAKQYQQHLRESGQKDLQDVSTESLRLLLSGSVPRRYDALVIDEVQDMTEKQLRVAMGTVSKRSWDQILLAGDPTQVLNGSGFEWRIPRALFYERTEEVPASKTLTRSFRAGAPTLRLPEALAERLREEGADVVSLDPEQARTTGNRPVRIPPGESVDEVLSRGHPDVLVLTADPETASTLQKKWGHPFIWTVSEAKGLEADHVVLYDLPDRLRSIPGTKPSQREAAKRKSQYHLRLHYVTQVAGYG